MIRFPRFPARLAAMAIAAFFLLSPGGARAQSKSAAPEEASDPILRALHAELARSKGQLKMENVDAPFYIEYRVFDVDQFEASAAFGALREQNRTRLRLLRATVLLGDYKVDSLYDRGQGISDILPLDNDELALRHQIWLATDQAYKRAGEALAAKKSLLKQLNVEQPVDDFAKADPVVSIGPRPKLDVDHSQVDQDAGIGDVRLQERPADPGHGRAARLHRAVPVFREYRRHVHAARLDPLPDRAGRQRAGPGRNEAGPHARILPPTASRNCPRPNNSRRTRSN